MTSYDAIAASLLADGDDKEAVERLSAVIAPDSAPPTQKEPHDAGADSPGAAAAAAAQGDDEDDVLAHIDIDYALSQLCVSESAAPELFAYEDVIVARAKKTLRTARRELAKKKRAAADAPGDTALDDGELTASCAVVEMERARIKYLLAWYHRLRLEKIEQYLDVIAAEQHAPDAAAAAAGDDGGDEGGEDKERLSDRLAPAELEFALGLHRLRLNHMERAFGSLLPAPYRVRSCEVVACSPEAAPGDAQRTAEDVQREWDRATVFITMDQDFERPISVGNGGLFVALTTSTSTKRKQHKQKHNMHCCKQTG